MDRDARSKNHKSLDSQPIINIKLQQVKYICNEQNNNNNYAIQQQQNTPCKLIR